MYDYKLTTIDNPFNPFTDFEQWYAFDESNGYHSSEYLARIAKNSDNLSDEENEALNEEAIDEIVKFNLSGKHIKVDRKGAEELCRRLKEQENSTA